MSKIDKYLAPLIKEYPEEYASKSYVWEEGAGDDWEDKYTIGGHTKRVLGQFNKYRTFNGEPLPKSINKDLFRNVLALHDIGVHRAVTENAKNRNEFVSAKREHQHEYTSGYLHDVLKKRGFSDKDILVAESIVSGDPLGSYLKGESGVSDTAQKIREAASKAGIPTKDFFSALNAYYMSDASSYTKDGGGIESLDYLFNPNGKDLSYSGYISKQIDRLKGELLVGKEKEGTWAKEHPFSESTGIPEFQNMSKNPEYFEKEKEQAGVIVFMSPDEYMQQSAYAQKVEPHRSYMAIMPKYVDEYAEMMKSGTKFDVPYLDFKRGEQEGRHRAMAAKKLGYDEIPVLIVDRPSKLKDTVNRIKYGSWATEYLYRMHHKNELGNLKRHGLQGNTPQEVWDKVMAEHPEYKESWEEGGDTRESSTWGVDDQETQDRRLYFVRRPNIPYVGDLKLRVKKDIADEHLDAYLEEDKGLPKEYFYDSGRVIPPQYIQVRSGKKWVPVTEYEYQGREKNGTWAKDSQGVWWHGTPSQDLKGGVTGLHVGTYDAAKQALNAKIGVPVEGDWDGRKEYGATLLAGKKRMRELEKKGDYCITGYNCDAPEEDYYPTHKAVHSDGSVIPLSDKPAIIPVKIIGGMTNTVERPHPDMVANGLMFRQKKLGKAKRGYYYKNISEDAGSVSAVVPSGEYVQIINDIKREKQGEWATQYDKYYSPEALEAIQGTEDASLTDKGLKLNVVRYQSPEIAGEQAIRTGVFYLPEKKSPYQRYYTTGRIGYGGKMRTEGMTTYRHPIVIKGASGGNVPKRAYDLIEGKGSYEKMRRDVLSNLPIAFYGNAPRGDKIEKIRDVLYKYGGNPDMAEDIFRASTKGNTLPYAIQEHIVASAVRGAGYDSVIGYNKVGGKTRLSEVFDVRQSYYPDTEKWEKHYEDFYKGKKVPEKLKGTWAVKYAPMPLQRSARPLKKVKGHSTRVGRVR